jgi:hypothetical protein
MLVLVLFAYDGEPKPLIAKKDFDASRWIKFQMKALI